MQPNIINPGGNPKPIIELLDGKYKKRMNITTNTLTMRYGFIFGTYNYKATKGIQLDYYSFNQLLAIALIPIYNNILSTN